MLDANPNSSLESDDLLRDLDQQGFVCLRQVLTQEHCSQLQGMYEDPTIAFRSTIDMARYNFGRGAYRYFAYPLPDFVQQLRDQFYPPLAVVANNWAGRLGIDQIWPNTLSELTAECHAAGQTRPTPLILKYGKGDYNCLHQDLYGDIHFPLQLVFFLSEPDSDYQGGEFVLTEQRPRMQTIPRVMRPSKGDAMIIPVRERPVKGARGWYRTQMRHGVSEVHSGQRFTLGLIFHDAS